MFSFYYLINNKSYFHYNRVPSALAKIFYVYFIVKKKYTYILVHTFSCVRFHTITLWPLLIKFFTIPLPIIPSPRKPNFRFDGRMFFSLRVWDIVSRSKGGVTCVKNRGLLGLEKDSNCAIFCNIFYEKNKHLALNTLKIYVLFLRCFFVYILPISNILPIF